MLLESRQNHRARREGVALTKEAGHLGKRQSCWCRVHLNGAGSVPSAAWVSPTRHWLGQPYPMVFFHPRGVQGMQNEAGKGTPGQSRRSATLVSLGPKPSLLQSCWTTTPCPAEAWLQLNGAFWPPVGIHIENG